MTPIHGSIAFLVGVRLRQASTGAKSFRPRKRRHCCSTTPMISRAKLIAVVGVIVAWLVMFPMIRLIVNQAPRRLYEIRSRSIRSKCAAIQTGSSRTQVNEMINKSVMPLQLTSSGNHLIFGVSSGTCTVEFDDKGFVSKTSLGDPYWQY